MKIMRVIIQRVKSSQVTVKGEIIAKIGRGLNLLVGIAKTDTDAELDWMVRKCLELRLFPDEQGGDKWQKSVQEIGGELLAIRWTKHNNTQMNKANLDVSQAPKLAF